MKQEWQHLKTRNNSEQDWEWTKKYSFLKFQPTAYELWKTTKCELKKNVLVQNTKLES